MTGMWALVRPRPVMSLTRRLFALVALALAIVAAVGVISLRSSADLIHSGHQVADAHEFLQALDALQSDVADVEAGQRGYVITGEETYLEPMNDAIHRVGRDLSRLDVLVDDEWVREHLDDLELLVEQLVSSSRQIVGLRRTHGFEAAAEAVRTQGGKAKMDAIRSLVAEMRTRQQAVLAVRTALSEGKARFANGAVIGGTIVSALLILAVFFLLAREAGAHRRTHHELRKSHALAEGILTSMADAVVVADPTGNVIAMNPAAERLFGRAASGAARALTLCCGDAQTPLAPEETPIGRAVRGESVDSFECVTRAEGRSEPVWLSISARSLTSASGDALGAVAVCRDVTAAKRAELELRETNESLRASVEELARRNDEISLLGELSGLLQACADESEAGSIIAQSFERLLPGSSGVLYLLNSSRNLAFAATRWGDPPPPEESFTPETCWALRRGQSHVLESHRLGLRCAHVDPSVGSYVCLPLVAQGEALGVLHVRLDLPSIKERGAAVQRLLRTLADEVGLALANLRLRETLRSQSIRDPLTNLFNRRYMEESLDRELQRATRRKAPLALLMLDIDHFKEFNDAFGHDAGDALLCELGARLQNSIRGEDLACRYGGEEFVIILPEASLADAQQRAESLREAAKRIVVRHQERTLTPVTLSLGVAVFPQHADSGKALLLAADRALYRAKTAGRDRIAIASDDALEVASGVS
ncbi:MAG TPA: diguanylate cyclase [Candidatus Binatia bacterium]